MVQTRIAAEEDVRRGQVEALQLLVTQNGQRLAATEATLAAVQTTLQRIDAKLDQIVSMHMKE